MDCTVPIENIRGLIVRKNEPKTENINSIKRKKILNQNKEKQNQQKIFPDNKRCLLPKQKSPTPKVKDLIDKCVIRPKTEKNYVKENIHTVKNMTCKEKQHIMQDSCDGHCQDLNRAGLELKYVFKKDYGKTPPYIQRNRHLIENMKKLEQDDVNKEVPGRSMRYVDDEEKDAVLNGLRSNLKEVEKQFLSLPIVTDTLSKRNRKIYLENLLLKLQQDIETLERHDIIIIND